MSRTSSADDCFLLQCCIVNLSKFVQLELNRKLLSSYREQVFLARLLASFAKVRPVLDGLK